MLWPRYSFIGKVTYHWLLMITKGWPVLDTILEQGSDKLYQWTVQWKSDVPKHEDFRKGRAAGRWNRFATTPTKSFQGKHNWVENGSLVVPLLHVNTGSFFV